MFTCYIDFSKYFLVLSANLSQIHWTVFFEVVKLRGINLNGRLNPSPFLEHCCNDWSNKEGCI